jgi:hypothetical protein
VSRGPSTFKQTDLTRAIKGARAAGIDVARIELNKNGRIIIVPIQTATASEIIRNEWDDVLGG